MNRIEEIAARAEAATQGPWFAHQEYIDMGVPDAHQTVTDSAERYKGKFIASVGLYSDVKDANADFVAHSQEDVLFLLEELRVAKCEAWVRGYVYSYAQERGYTDEEANKMDVPQHLLLALPQWNPYGNAADT